MIPTPVAIHVRNILTGLLFSTTTPRRPPRPRAAPPGAEQQAFFYFYIFQNCFLQKYIFGFIIYRFIPLSPGCGAADPLPPSYRAGGTLM